MKYTPALIVAEDPVYAEAFCTAVTATDVPAEFWSTSLFWNSLACTLFVILPPEVYFTYKVIVSFSEVSALIELTTSALTPDVRPVNSVPALNVAALNVSTEIPLIKGCIKTAL